MKSLPFCARCSVVILSVLCLAGCVTAQASADSFDGLWTKRECAQTAADFVAALDASGFAADFLQSHGQKPSVTVGFFGSGGEIDAGAAQFASYVASEARRAKSFDLVLYENGTFGSEDEALAWAERNGIDYLICGTVLTVRENPADGLRPVLRYEISCAVSEPYPNGQCAYRWEDRHITKAVRRMTAE